MTMIATENRIKTRLILEARYPTIPAIYDKRGVLLKSVMAKFEDKAGQFKLEDGAIRLADNFSLPRKTIYISHSRMAVNYEGPTSIEEFTNDCKELLKLTRYQFNDELKELNRIGCRAISIFKHKEAKSFNDVHEAIKARFLSTKPPLSIPVPDCRIILTDPSSFNAELGPARFDETWTKQNFNDVEEMSPKFGIGLDIDGYGFNYGAPKVQDLDKAIDIISTFTGSIERELVADLIG